MADENNPLGYKSENFAVRIIKLCDMLYTKNNGVLARQLLRSGTSIGANVAEGQAGQSVPDMLSKFKIAEKEARESKYWLKLLLRSDKISKETYVGFVCELDEIISMLVASCCTLSVKKGNLSS